MSVLRTTSSLCTFLFNHSLFYYNNGKTLGEKMLREARRMRMSEKAEAIRHDVETDKRNTRITHRF